MANQPKSNKATCQNCGEVITWGRPRLPLDKEQENLAVQRINDRKKKENPRPEGKGFTEWELTLDLLKLPHKIEGSWSERWWHYREDEGTTSHCPSKRKVDTLTWKYDTGSYKKGEKYEVTSGPTAKPKEFCSETINAQYSTYMCNRPVKGESPHGEPLCGRHLAVIRKDEEKQRVEQEKRELKNYILSATHDLCKILQEDFGLKVEPHEKRVWRSGYWEHEPDGKVVVDPKALLSLLEETFE